jgi:hypothetical protein
MPNVPFDPAGFLTIARTLVGRGNADEAELRTAVGRAYYGVFLVARERLTQTGEIIPTWTSDDHWIVITALRSRGGPYGDQLHRLRGERNRDDYDLRFTRTQSASQQVMILAESVLNNL